MANEQLITELNQLAEQCTEVSIDELISNPKWGTISFEGCRPELERAFSMLNQFKLLPTNLLPDAQASQIVQALKPLEKTLLAIRNFSIETGNPTGQRDQLITQIRSQSDQFFSAAHLYIPYLAYQKGDVQRNITELTSSAAQASQLVVATKNECSAKSEEIGKIIIAAREAAASVGVAHFTADFNAESESLESNAGVWLKATGGSAALTLFIALGLVFVPINSDATVAQTLQLFTSKVVILGLLFTATIWCGRLYKAAKHQAVINKHRANALRTFQAFTKAASDDGMRDAVLLETTKSIFAITQSGYLENETAPESGAKVVEVIRNVSQTASSMK
jgi:hypothetical protein